MRKPTWVVICVLALGFSAEPSWSRSKTDVVIINNGDRVTCEIKELKLGKLKVKTDAMGTIEIEWDEIAALHSDFYFRVESTFGERYYGTLSWAEGESELRIVQASQIVSIEAIDVVEIVPIEQSFLTRLDGSLSIGFDFTKASNVATLRFDWTNTYRGERNLFDLKVNTVVTDKRTEEELTRRGEVTFSYSRLTVFKRMVSYGTGSVQRNDELGVRRRLLVGGGIGVTPFKSNHHLLILSAGLVLNSEASQDTTGTVQSLEAQISGRYTLFQYDSPKTDINTKLDVFPSLTEQDRVRVEFEVKLRREIVSDLFFDLTYYTSHDNKPPSGEASKNDYGIVTSLGWSY